MTSPVGRNTFSNGVVMADWEAKKGKRKQRRENKAKKYIKT